MQGVKAALRRSKLEWKETNHLVLRRGPYVIAAGLDESVSEEPTELHGRFVNLFDAELQVNSSVQIAPGSRYFLVDLDRVKGGTAQVIASAGKVLVQQNDHKSLVLAVEGVSHTPGLVLIYCPVGPPRSASLDGSPIGPIKSSHDGHLAWLKFTNESAPRKLEVSF